MTPTAKRPRTRWQISLREILQIMIALGAVLTLVAQQRPFQSSPFLRTFDEYCDLRSTADELKIGCTILTAVGRLIEGPRRARREYELVIELQPGTELGPLLTAWRERVLRQLSEANCTLIGHGVRGEPKDQTVTSFSFDYEASVTAGEINVQSVVESENRYRLQVDLFEFPR